MTKTEKGGRKGVYVRLDAEYPLSGVNYAAAEVAVEALRRQLVRALDGTGMSVEITSGFHTYPQERFWMFLSCEGGTDLDAVREGIQKAAKSTLSAKDLNAFKAAALAGMIARYGIGKDLVTHYKESVNGVTAARITEMLSALAAGSTAEIVIE